MPSYNCHPHAEVIGKNLRAFHEHTLKDQVLPILEEHNLTSVDVNQWYRLQNWLSVLNDLSDRSNSMSNYVSIGLGISKNTIIPSELQQVSLPDFLDHADAIYQYQHRGADVGEIMVEHLAPQHIRLCMHVVYPDYLEYGVFFGFARRFLPKGTRFKVYFDNTIKRYDLGGEMTVLHIQW